MPQGGEKDEIKEKIQFIVFIVSDEEFGVKITNVREVVRLLPIIPIPKVPAFLEGVINLRGEIVPVIDLAKRFYVAPKERTNETRIMIVELAEKTAGLIVDEVSEVLRIPVENIEHTPDLVKSCVHTDFIKGVGKVDDRLIILLDLDEVLTMEEKEELATMELPDKIEEARK
jgi:purine-binding chemotaxis protein CheW